VALARATREAQLEGKAGSRNVVGMAKGIIMASQRVSNDDAFDILGEPRSGRNVSCATLPSGSFTRLTNSGSPDDHVGHAALAAGRSCGSLKVDRSGGQHDESQSRIGGVKSVGPTDEQTRVITRTCGSTP